MNRSAIRSLFWEQALKDQKTIDFHPSPLDSTHFIVSRHLEDGTETIGHVYVEFEGDEFRYISTNGKGKEIFPSTTDFNLVEINFEKYARFLALQKVRENHNRSKILNYNLNLKNTYEMETQSSNTIEKPQKQNQLRFIEYEKPTGDGHFITIGDSYHNVIGRIHKSHNEETKKIEYIAFDHAGNIMSTSNRLLDVKNEFIKNRDQLLEQAHQRRIASKGKSKELSNEKSPSVQQFDRTDKRKIEMENLRGTSGRKKQNEKTISDKRSNSNNKGVEDKDNEKRKDNFTKAQSLQEERAEELQNVRDKEEDRGDNERER